MQYTIELPEKKKFYC